MVRPVWWIIALLCGSVSLLMTVSTAMVCSVALWLVVEPAMARSSLCTVYQYNVCRFCEGALGAVNGMRPDGEVDDTCMQSMEVWTGKETYE